MNPLSERALEWLALFCDSRRSKRAASLELGHAENWAGRLLSRKEPCNWDYVEMARMAAALGITALQMDEAVRNLLVPAGRPSVSKPEIKRRRVRKSGKAQEIVQVRSHRG